MDTTLEQPVCARMIISAEQDFSVPLTLRYTSTDPLAVHMDFPSEATHDRVDITWSFSRDLLWTGMTAPAGEGDVHIWPCGQSSTVVEFYGAHSMALLQFDTEVLLCFLLRTYLAVAAGQEEVGPAIDRCLSVLAERRE
ncbi:SsgA family sporulation/cell division regulator [Streptomyces sp. NPDC059680]|uniref:SsgA family sporulation/cell division regulator n=1 Tax=Streptomyces sp. NPDC059680 TaxID=3346904 RepID=UPI0036CE188C